MKRVFSTVALMIMLLSGCTINVGGPKATPSPESSLSSTEQVYVETVRDAGAGVDRSDADLIEGGHMVCDAMTDYGVETTVTELVMDPDTDPAQIGTIIGAAAVAFCPQHIAELESLASDVA